MGASASSGESTGLTPPGSSVPSYGSKDPEAARPPAKPPSAADSSSWLVIRLLARVPAPAMPLALGILKMGYAFKKANIFIGLGLSDDLTTYVLHFSFVSAALAHIAYLLKFAFALHGQRLLELWTKAPAWAAGAMHVFNVAAYANNVVKVPHVVGATIWMIGFLEWHVFCGIFVYRVLFGDAPYGLLALRRGNGFRERAQQLWRASVCSMFPALIGIAAAVDTGHYSLVRAPCPPHRPSAPCRS